MRGTWTNGSVASRRHRRGLPAVSYDVYVYAMAITGSAPVPAAYSIRRRGHHDDDDQPDGRGQHELQRDVHAGEQLERPLREVQRSCDGPAGLR